VKHNTNVMHVQFRLMVFSNCPFARGRFRRLATR
jgi:hypothetical protein